MDTLSFRRCLLLSACGAFIGMAVSCGRPDCPFQDADLVFVRSADSYMDQAISAATSDGNMKDDFTHVAILEVQDDSVFVVEAAPDLGVVRRPFSEFCEDNCHGSMDDVLVFKRVRPEVISQLAQRRGVDDAVILHEFVEVAKSMVGLPYDYEYRPLNGRMYCSELVYDSYVEMIPKPWDPHLFKEAPMNFLASDGSLPEFWRFNFEIVQGIPVPQGEPGTNPNDMAKADILMDFNADIKWLKAEIYR